MINTSLGNYLNFQSLTSDKDVPLNRQFPLAIDLNKIFPVKNEGRETWHIFLK